MIADVILGVNIDTENWIADLKESEADNIFVLDYEYFGEPDSRGGVIFISPLDAKKYLKIFDSVCFYKSMYVYPGMGGKMSSLYKK